MRSDAKGYTVSSGNVFADLGFDEPEAELAKADLARGISRLIQRRGWRQAQAAVALDVDQSKISAIVRGRLAGFSLQRLIKLLTQLEQDVQISVMPKRSEDQPARLSVRLSDEPQEFDSRRVAPAAAVDVTASWALSLEVLHQVQESARRSNQPRSGGALGTHLPTSGPITNALALRERPSGGLRETDQATETARRVLHGIEAQIERQIA